METKIETNAAAIAAPDLTAHAPRSPRSRLGGFAILPRLLDKCRADLVGRIGEYHTNCTIDQEFLSFAGIDYDVLRERLAEGLSDGEVLKWISSNAGETRTPWEISQWSDYQNHRSPAPNTGLYEYFSNTLSTIGEGREDIRSWADLLDLDDYCSFGGVA